MEKSDHRKVVEAPKWPFALSLSFLIAGAATIPISVLYAFTQSATGSSNYYWLIILLPFTFFIASVVFGIFTIVKRRKTGIPLVAISSSLTLMLAFMDIVGTLMGAVIGGIESYSSSMISSLRKEATFDNFLDKVSSNKLTCSYCDENSKWYETNDEFGDVLQVLNDDFSTTKLDEPRLNLTLCLTIDFEIDDSSYEQMSLSLSTSYTQMEIYCSTGFGFSAENYYTVSESNGKKLYNAIKGTIEKKEKVVNDEMEKAKKFASYDSFISEKKLNMSNPYYYSKDYKTKYDEDQSILNLLASLKPTLNTLEPKLDASNTEVYYNSQFVYGIGAASDAEEGKRFIAINFTDAAIKLSYPFKDSFGDLHSIFASYSLTAEEATNLQQNIANIVSSASSLK